MHDDTPEGLRTGLRDFLRPSRGVSEKSLPRSVAMFEWGADARRATSSVLRALLGVRAAIETTAPTFSHS